MVKPVKISRFIIVSIAVFLLAFLIPTNSYASWQRSRAITIDHTKVPNTNQTDFPVLISGTYTYLKTTGNGGSVESLSGYDIAFFSDAALTTPLKFEVESWSATTGDFVAWVKIPSLSHTVDTVIYLAYGNTSISSDQSDKTNVWDGSYNNVWHFKNPSTPDLTDSTTQAWNLTNSSATATTGKIAGGLATAGAVQYVSVASKSLSASTVTISGWFKRAWTSHSYQAFFSWNYDATTGIGIYLDSTSASDWVTGDTIMFGNGYAIDNNPRVIASLGSLTDNTWHYLVFEAGGSVAKTYLDGVPLSMRVANTGAISAITSQTLYLFKDQNTYCNCNSDEVRLSTIARPDDWIATEYNNQSSPSTFYSVGEEASFSINPTSIVQNSTGNIITLTGINTLWTAGTPGTPTFTLSGGTGASITLQTVNSSTSATLTITAGSAVGTLTIADPTNSSTATLTVTADVTAPVISNVSASALNNSATITWTTNEASSSIVSYGLTSGYGTTTTEADTSPRVTTHTVVISGLSNCTLYHYLVSSKDATTNTGTGSDSTFTTSGCSVGGHGRRVIIPQQQGQQNTITTPSITSPPPANIPLGGIKSFSSLRNIKSVQDFLNWSLGSQILPLKIDGKLGIKTINAIRLFQKNNGLKSDGSFGKISASKAVELLGGR